MPQTEERGKLNEPDQGPILSFRSAELAIAPYRRKDRAKLLGTALHKRCDFDVPTPPKTATHLQNMPFFDKPECLTCYLSPDEQYMKPAAYIDPLDYLPLSTLQ